MIVSKTLLMPAYNLKINGVLHTVEADSDTPLLWVLRDHLDLVGTKFGCGIAQCGACTVHVNGNATRSCSLPVASLQGMEITTIEGLSEDGTHPVQNAWKTIDVPQCGYCQSGQIMTASAFLNQNSNPSNSEIRNAMHGNICRCASYNSIEKAVKMAAKDMS
jgi:isoquinoline 1-oxidoreductase alpha subunit